MSVLQYGLEHLKIPHIVVCGHYGCGGVKASVSEGSHGIVDNWIYSIKEVYDFFEKELKDIQDKEQMYDKLSEYNVMW